MSRLLRKGHYIDGCWLEDGPRYPVRNPADGTLITEVAKAGVAETDQAIAAAQRRCRPGAG